MILYSMIQKKYVWEIPQVCLFNKIPNVMDILIVSSYYDFTYQLKH